MVFSFFFNSKVSLQCCVPKGDLHCQCILLIFTASVHQFYVNILVFNNINPFFISTTNLHWTIFQVRNAFYKPPVFMKIRMLFQKCFHSVVWHCAKRILKYCVEKKSMAQTELSHNFRVIYGICKREIRLISIRKNCKQD